ncbi:hypothetical protein ANN_22139 [Periplaneta americana]|uniref:Mos1 transposase HTH domain-containing protein n=1 Tax=Periplaneta americana TaxID=6978 RepID=A0ABQ8S7U3_PERAM|nr:hypothetical protein ANN_22139 [Periplaneta americana]
MAGLCEGGSEPPGSVKAIYWPRNQVARRYGHIQQMSQERWPMTLINWSPLGRRKKDGGGNINSKRLCFAMFTKQEQRYWLKIQSVRGRTARQCHDGLVEACGETALPYRTVARWIRDFN